MYWPTSAARILGMPAPLADEAVARVRPSRRGNLFATLTERGLGVWDTRPTVLQAAVVRTKASIERWGANADVFWAYDSRGLIILTTTSHLLLYHLVPTGTPVYESGAPGQDADPLLAYELRPAGAAFAMGKCQGILAQPHNLLISLRHPPGILSVPYPIPPQLLTSPGSHFPPLPLDGETEEQVECELWELTRGSEWISGADSTVPMEMTATRVSGLPVTYSLITEDGRAIVFYASQQVAKAGAGQSKQRESKYTGALLYPAQDGVHEAAEELKGLALDTGEAGDRLDGSDTPAPALTLVDDRAAPRDPPASAAAPATAIAVNGRIGHAAVGTSSGLIHIFTLPSHPEPPVLSHTLDLKSSANLRVSPGAVTSLAWTSDGAALAAGYEHAWAVWSMSGRLNGWGCASHHDDDSVLADAGPADAFMHGVTSLFWAPGNLDLFMHTADPHRLYAMPFVKSASTGQISPDNTRYAFLQMDDRVMVYRGADQPDMSVINPESDVWQHIHIPTVYLAANWPIRYASISSDGRFIAVAGRRGLTHYSAASGRWKLFAQEREERAFAVRGGLLWFHHVLIAAVDADGRHQLRLYSRDLDLSDASVLHAQTLPSPVVVMTLLDNSLLVYTADSMLYHFVILPTRDAIRLTLCGSISFRGLLEPSRVRALSWLLPSAQVRLGDPSDDLVLATVIVLLGDRLLLLRPRRSGPEQVRYDLQLLAPRIETYWTHLRGVGGLENSLWGYNGSNMLVWLHALTVDSASSTYESVAPSLALPLDFYPLSILMDKGIVIGVEHEASTRALPFALYKLSTGTHLFLPQMMRHALREGVGAALGLAENYSELVYFGHGLEVLLHSVLEDEVDRASGGAAGADDAPVNGKALSGSTTSNTVSRGAEPVEPETEQVTTDCQEVTPTPPAFDDAAPPSELALAAAFIAHFPAALDAVVSCARKTEQEHWGALFAVVGAPRALYERCVAAGALRTAAGYLLVMHAMEEGEGVVEGAGAEGVEPVGGGVKGLEEESGGDIEGTEGGVGIGLPTERGGAGGAGARDVSADGNHGGARDTVELLKLAMAAHETQLCKELLRFLHSMDESGAALRAAEEEVGILPRVELVRPPKAGAGAGAGAGEDI